MFSSKSLIDSGLTFRSVILFVYGVRKCSSFILLQVSTYLILKSRIYNLRCLWNLLNMNMWDEVNIRKNMQLSIFFFFFCSSQFLLKYTSGLPRVPLIIQPLIELLLLLLSHFSRVRLCATPSLGFSRREHWSGLPFLSPVHKSEK